MDQLKEEFSFKSILVSNEPTFHHNNMTSVSQIDTILYFIPESTDIQMKFSEQLCKLEQSQNLSAHDVIIGNITLPLNKQDKTEEQFSETYQQLA